MLIICEGPDGSGKTTLVERVAAELRTAYPSHVVEVRRCGVPPAGSHPLDLYGRPLVDYRPGRGHHIVYDRFHVGEWVYPALLNRPSRADEASWRWLELLLAARGALLVRAVTDLATLETNVRRDGDDLVPVDRLAAVANAYEYRLRSSTLPRFDYRLGDPLAVAEIIARARRAEFAVRSLAPFITYVGWARPRYLLLGDVRRPLADRVTPETPPESTRHIGPAFGPYPATSGHYLLANLPEKLLEVGVGLANACDVDDVTALHAALGHPPTAVLGRRAWHCAVRAGLAVGAAPHPQYVRRFHHRHGFSYGQVITSALNGANELTWRP